MKKLIITVALSLSLVAVSPLAACTDNTEESGETVSIMSLDAAGKEVKKEVPKKPGRVAILDYAVMDIMDYLGVGDTIVASCEGTIEYLDYYWNKMENGEITNLGTLKSYDMEALMQSEPDIIFIGGRQSAAYAEIEKIAPVVYLKTDGENYYSDIKKNVNTIATVFGIQQSVVNSKLSASGIDNRISAIAASYGDADCLIMMYTSSPTVTNTNCYLIDHELGFNNIYNSYMDGQSETHGSSISWESILTLNPEYLFVLNRGYITSGTANSAVLADLQEDADSIGYTGKIIVLENPDAWYTASGGIWALGIMLSDVESGLSS